MVTVGQRISQFALTPGTALTFHLPRGRLHGDSVGSGPHNLLLRLAALTFDLPRDHIHWVTVGQRASQLASTPLRRLRLLTPGPHSVGHRGAVGFTPLSRLLGAYLPQARC